ncbi:hypothetical protein FOQG_19415 [Fusarium oxysporum f. sp. raphani 54005]|uniref:Uncharacterized protein n=1 Tax=Fusarium oxysporum f. sp. raphani 54005 TaxID=1089458 RepID=X0B133_FUSOX|nr:hypothetical protein FOQG_19415 [Fusarium oxysporum f. sp. raphani 54005]
MATPWPQDEIWRTDYREHATNLSKYLQKALSAIDSGNGQPIASHGVRVALIGALYLIVKIQSTPDLGHISEIWTGLDREVWSLLERQWTIPN